MYKIGEFSKIINVPTRTLRFYDEIGILQPSLVDKFTGYRYYSEQDILDYQYIKLLKYLGFTLGEIQRNKNNFNCTVLEDKKNEIAMQIQSLKLKYSEIQSIINELEKGNSLNSNSFNKKYIKTNL